jgi:hypothetical protein
MAIVVDHTRSVVNEIYVTLRKGRVSITPESGYETEELRKGYP